MEEVITKESVEELMRIDGRVRGIALKSHASFIVKGEGKEGLQRLTDFMAELGCPVDYKNIGTWKFYPVAIEAVELLAIRQLFNYEDKKFEELGAFGAAFSIVMKIFLQHFVSISILASQASQIWRRYYTIGDLKVKELNENERYVILLLENFLLHRLHCFHVKGFLAHTVKMAVGKEVTCEERKCPSRGDPVHEFLIKW
ncbi:MAG: hypothetical protein ABIF89_00750 [bacterium]